MDVLEEANTKMPKGYRLERKNGHLTLGLYREDLQALVAGTDTPCLRRILRVLDEYGMQPEISLEQLPDW